MNQHTPAPHFIDIQAKLDDTVQVDYEPSGLTLGDSATLRTLLHTDHTITFRALTSCVDQPLVWLSLECFEGLKIISSIRPMPSAITIHALEHFADLAPKAELLSANAVMYPDGTITTTGRSGGIALRFAWI